MNILVVLAIGFFAGLFAGVLLMCLLQVNRVHRFTNEIKEYKDNK